MKYLKRFENSEDNEDLYDEIVESVKSKFKSYGIKTLEIFYSSKEYNSNLDFNLDVIKLKNDKWTSIHEESGKIYLNWRVVEEYETWELLDVLRYFENVPQDVIDSQIAEQEAEKFNM